MKLYFLRHATASDRAPTDEERKLTQGGTREARIAGLVLRKFAVKPAFVLTSPLVRARQTAEIACAAMGWGGVVNVSDGLGKEASPRALLGTLKDHRRADEILLVGHSPSFPQSIAEFLGAKRTDAIQIGKGAIACIDLEVLGFGQGHLKWLLGQKQMRFLVPGPGR